MSRSSSGTHENKRPAALHHRRQRGRRQEHADRAAAVRLQRRLRGPARRRRARPPANARQRRVDLALLTDGLRAEREQGITIDVAYRYFATPRRKFIIADTPGHEQYTRNMATGASTAEPGDHPDRRAQGRADRNRAGTPSSPRCCGSRTWWWRSTRWTWWTTSRTSSTASRANSRTCSQQLDIRDITLHPDQRAGRRQRRPPQRRTCPGTTGPALLHYLETVHVAARPQPYATSASRCSTCCVRTWISAASPAPWPRGIVRTGRRGDGAALGRASARQVHRHLRRRADRGLRAACR